MQKAVFFFSLRIDIYSSYSNTVLKMGNEGRMSDYSSGRRTFYFLVVPFTLTFSVLSPVSCVGKYFNRGTDFNAKIYRYSLIACVCDWV
jgi:hypothetical protein